MKKYDDPKEYKEALLSPHIIPQKIMKDITIPESVFKYRQFGDYLYDSLGGKVFFSLPSKINANDPDDCIVWIDKQKCVEHIMDICACEERLARYFYHMLAKNWINPYTDNKGKSHRGLQDMVKIGCFSTVHPEEKTDLMWKTFSNTGGYCIEYETKQECFYPANIIFLPVCYELDSRYDDTDYVLRIIDFLKEQLDKGIENPSLDESFVPQGYNHVLFKPSCYCGEYEWRVIVTCNRDTEYFDEQLINGGKKFMSKCIKCVYIRKDSVEEDAKKVIDYCSTNGIAIKEV